MKSIATELVSDFIYNQINNLYVEEIIIKAKAHALTCQTILDYYGGGLSVDLYDWCENEIQILREGGLI